MNAKGAMHTITPMEKEDIPFALSIGRDQFNRYCNSKAFPDFWSAGKDAITQYLMKQIEKGNAITAQRDGSIVGYMAWTCFDFHAERTALLPIAGSAAAGENRDAIYHALYAAASEKWVRDARFNHLWMIYYDDAGLKDLAYDLGFGSHVVDACQKTHSRALPSASNWKVTRATDADIDAVLALGNRSERNLSEAPIFLARDSWNKKDIGKLVRDQQVLVAWDGDSIVGILSFDINPEEDLEHLTTRDSAYIGGIGAYTVPEYRRKGVGSKLVQEAFAYCNKAGKHFLHVDFETANPDAFAFWPKYFKPALRSVRRTVNKDANSRL